jgi:hypothetical protein
LYVLLRLGNSGSLDLADNFRYDHGGQQADYDHDNHDLDKGEPACTRETDVAGSRRTTNTATVR